MKTLLIFLICLGIFIALLYYTYFVKTNDMKKITDIKNLNDMKKITDIKNLNDMKKMIHPNHMIEKKSPKILILIISFTGHERWNFEKEIWIKQIEKNIPNIDIFFIECARNHSIKNHSIENNQYMLIKNCNESFIPGIYQKSLLALKDFPNYDFYVRTNLSTFFIFDHLKLLVKTLPISVPIFSGHFLKKKKIVSGTGILFNKKARDILLQEGFETEYFNNNKLPDDVLISQIFFKNNVQYYELENKKTLYFDYQQTLHSQLKEIQTNQISMCRMKHTDLIVEESILKKMLPCFKILYIKNWVDYHYEIIESIYEQYSQIILDNLQFPIVYIDIIENKSFQDYFSKKYPNVIFQKPVNNYYDYCIDCTYSTEYLNYYKEKSYYLNDNKHFYIQHTIQPSDLDKKNIYYLTPLAKQRYLSCHYLPFRNLLKKNQTVPIFILQGDVNYKNKQKSRHYSLLCSVLKRNYYHDYKIKIIGRGDTIPDEFLPFKDKIIFKSNLNFEDYHKEFLDGYAILTLTSKKYTPRYYKNCLTSSINYAKAYELYAIIDKDLQDIYHLSKAFIYEKEDDFTTIFEESLNYFYQNIAI